MRHRRPRAARGPSHEQGRWQAGGSGPAPSRALDERSAITASARALRVSAANEESRARPGGGKLPRAPSGR